VEPMPPNGFDRVMDKVTPKPPTGHTSYVCWQRGTEACERDGRVLFQRVDGTVVGCNCDCHRKGA